jgi:hypothetical protein
VTIESLFFPPFYVEMPSFPPILTQTFLSSLRTHPVLPKQSWYFIAAVTISIINRPDEIQKVYTYALNHEVSENYSPLEHDERLNISRRIREALVKASTIGGVPRVSLHTFSLLSNTWQILTKMQSINALLALKEVTPEELLDEPLAYSPTSRRDEVNEPSSGILERGQRYFDQVYGKVSKRIMGQMDHSGTEDLGLIARLMYGYILSNTNVLSPAETSYVMIGGLIPMDVSQYLSHS